MRLTYDPSTVNDFALIPALIALGVALACVLVYMLGSRGAWKRSLLGVAFAGVILAAVPFMLVPIFRRLYGTYPGYEWAAWSGYLLADALYITMFIAILVTQRTGDRALAGLPIASPKGARLMSDSPINTSTVPAIWYKAQRVLRTIVAVGIPAFLTFALVLPQVIDALGLPVDGQVYLALIGFAALVTAVAGAITRLMAIPAVNALLVKVGLGSVPASAVTGVTASSPVPQVAPDPKATQ